MSLTLKDKEKIIKTLYERCSIGEISVMQRELLLKKLNDETAPEFKPITEACENSIETRRKKFNIISTKLYKECANGKISLEQREILLERARGEYLTEGVILEASDDFKKISASPLKSVAGIKFGMTRDEVSNVINKKSSTFKKTSKSSNTTDNYGFCHVYYDSEDKCEAIEIFDDVEVYINNKLVFPTNIDDGSKIISGLSKDGKDSYISKSKSIGITVSGDKMKTITFGVKGYYDKNVNESADNVITEGAIGNMIDKTINDIQIKFDIAKFKKMHNELVKIEKDYYKKTGGYLTFSGPYSMDDLIKNLKKYYTIMNADLKDYKKYSDDYSAWAEKFDKSYNAYMKDRDALLNKWKTTEKRYEYRIQDFLDGYMVAKRIQRTVLDGVRECKNWKCDGKERDPKFNAALQHCLALYKKMVFTFLSDYETAFNNVYKMCKDKKRVEAMKSKYGTSNVKESADDMVTEGFFC